MPWFDALVGEPFLEWLRAAAGSRYMPQAVGDPFATSMRDFDDVSSNLVSLNAGQAIEKQRLTDLRGAKLASSTDSTLSPLGKAVLDAWTKYGVATTVYENELPRQLSLVCEALLAADPLYEGVEAFWNEKSDKYGADTLMERWEALFLLTHFSKRLNDFSPMDHVAKIDSTLPDWKPEALRQKLQTMVVKDDAALKGLERVAKGIEDSASRGKARKIFMIALELARDPSPAEVNAKLAKWTIPATSTSKEHAAISANTRNLCSAILNDYRDRLLEIKARSPKYLDTLLFRKNIVMFGPPGTGKTFAAQALAEYWKGRHGNASVVSVTFHPSYSYEDFVWGWRPDRESHGTKFVPQLGALLEACKIADDGVPTLLVIDEINRADTAKVFGELITFIEADKRGIYFRLAQDPTVDRAIPSNLYVLGTMNTADRSVSLLDVALRRRFAFIEFVPDGAVFGLNTGWQEVVDGILVADLMNEINRRLLKAGVEPDRAIGHALFAVPSSSSDAARQLYQRFQFDIHPLIVDYCFSDRSRVVEVLGPLVAADGRMQQLDEKGFLSALRLLVGHSGVKTTEINDIQAPGSLLESTESDVTNGPTDQN